MNKERINQIMSELRFLRSESIKELVREADIGCCHEDCVAIERRKKKLLASIKKGK